MCYIVILSGYEMTFICTALTGGFSDIILKHPSKI